MHIHERCFMDNLFLYKILGSILIIAEYAKFAAAEPSKPTIEIRMDVIDGLQQTGSPTNKQSVIPVATPTPGSSTRPNIAEPGLPSYSTNMPAQTTTNAPTIAAQPTPHANIGYAEAGAEIHSLTGNYPNWSGVYAKGEAKSSNSDSWNIETVSQRKFDDGGFYGAIGNTHTFNENWFSNLTFGAGRDAFFLPKYRIDGFLNHKWGNKKQFITSIGIGFYKAMQIYEDKNISLGAAYYFDSPFILQGGIRFNRSSPGSVDAVSGWGAITEGRDKKHFITLRYGYGEEAYELLGENIAINNFYSHDVSLNWRQWLGEDWGLNLRGEFYHNPSYVRRGIALGIFREF